MSYMQYIAANIAINVIYYIYDSRSTPSTVTREPGFPGMKGQGI
jgi:hypothetical protein